MHYFFKLFTFFILLFVCLDVTAQKITYSIERGFYSSTQLVSLVAADLPGATIRYSTNGTLPTPTSGTIYTSPITIFTTSTITAIAYNSTDTTDVKSHTYLFLNDVVNQPNTVLGFPTGDFEFDNTITGNTSYSTLLDTALRQIPSMCLTLDMTDFNLVHNDTLEKIVSVEIINGDGSKGDQATAGIKRVGTTSLNSPKRTFRLNFKSEFGDSKFNYPLMGPNAADEFDQIQLRPGFHNVINGGGSTGGYDLYDQFLRNLQEDIQEDNVTLHGTFVHLYINNVYWGIYNPTERGTDNFAKKYYDGAKDNWDAIKGGTARSGNTIAWDSLNNFANTQDLTIQANYDTIKKLIEVEQFIDYVMLTNFGPHGNHDPIGDNSFATRHRLRDEGFRFWIWNTEEPPASPYIYNTGAGPFDNLYNALLTNDDFKTLLYDRVQCNCYDEGKLTSGNTTNAYNEIFNAVELAYICEAARWASAVEYINFQSVSSTISNTFLPARTAALISNYSAAGLLSPLNAVQFSVDAGLVSMDTSLTLTNPNGSGSIYYTLDGTDPRSPGGGLNPAAILYSGPITINDIYSINARVYDGINWSGSCPKEYYIPQNYSDFVINEIHYHPVDTIIGMDTIDESDLEFIEFYNKGVEPINLTGVQISDGGDYVFPDGFVIDTSEYIVIAKDDVVFQTIYGLTANGDYNGNLANSGEDIVIKDPFGVIIDSVRYDDKFPWNPLADGTGPSLGLIDFNMDNNVSSNWNVQKGQYTPFAENDFCTLELNVINADSPTGCTTNNGLIFVNGLNGNPGGPQGYTYLWNTGQMSNFDFQLSEGIYIISVFDADECEATDTVTLVDPTNLTASVSIDSTYNNVTVYPVDGVGPYTYLWSNGATDQTVNNLDGGYYQVQVTDDVGCSTWVDFDITGKDCPNNLIVLSPVNQGIYQVSESIISDGTIDIKDVAFRAGTFISLENNFEVTGTFSFLAEIDPCQ